MNTRLAAQLCLPFLSGLCALVYQVVWFREFRLVFGASTAAQAAVIAVFMGGIGLGSIRLASRAERDPRPLAFYARLELWIAVSAMVSPLLVLAARSLYVAMGGTVVLGTVGGTALRLLLSALVLAVPTFLMGGTLPALARAFETEGDARRDRVAFLYGANTLGAVTGTFLATFFLIERLGNRRALVTAAVVNALVAFAAALLARRAVAVADEPRDPAAADVALAAPVGFTLAAAAVVGFAFFFLETVWYRVLTPLLGGSTYTFGVILGLALFGIGFGSMLYSLAGRGRPATLEGFAWTCGLEALLVGLPLATGDLPALIALFLRPFGVLGFGGQVFSWIVVAGLLVVPPAVIAGYQFPLLVALLGRGRRGVGRDVGRAYAWNTVGGIAGALAGGFGALPLLGAVGAWRGATVLLVALAAAALVVRSGPTRRSVLVRAGAWGMSAVVLGIAAFGPGPSSVWRHGGIGAARAPMPGSANALHTWMNDIRRTVLWEADGRESTVALVGGAGMSFVSNGRGDGHTHGDAPTQVMAGLVGAVLHGAPRKVLVIGLGTGTTAGWLGRVPGIERVDVVEFEEAILRVAEACEAVNAGVLQNPKVHIHVADGREFLLTTPERYDLIVSAPSNPFRAGVSSLFTREYYRSARERLAEGGLFLQWMQAYEVDAMTVRDTFATLKSEFASVQTWETLVDADMLLVASTTSRTYDPAVLRERLAGEPFTEGMRAAWRTEGLEGLLAAYVGGDGLADFMAEGAHVNTDDRNLLEYALARTVGTSGLFRLAQLREASRDLGQDRLPTVEPVDADAIEEQQFARWARARGRALLAGSLPQDAARASRVRAMALYAGGDLAGARTAWSAQSSEPQGLYQLEAVAESLAVVADPAAEEHIYALRSVLPAQGNAVLARLLWERGKHEEAFDAMRKAIPGFRYEAWTNPSVVSRALGLVVEMGARDSRAAAELFDLLEEPFAAQLADDERLSVRIELALLQSAERDCVAALRPLEPHVPWRRAVLESRLRCYTEQGSPLAAVAAADLAAFLAREPEPLDPVVGLGRASAQP